MTVVVVLTSRCGDLSMGLAKLLLILGIYVGCWETILGSSISGTLTIQSKWLTVPTVVVQAWKLNASGNPMSDLDLYQTPPTSSILASACSACPSSTLGSMCCSYTIPGLPQGAYSVAGFVDVGGDRKFHPETIPAALGWCANAPQDLGYKAISLPSSGSAVTCDFQLTAVSPWPATPQTDVNGKLFNVNGLNVLHSWGTPYERGFAQGKLLSQQILDFFVFYQLEQNIGSASDYVNVVVPYLNTYFTIPAEMQEEMSGVIDGMVASGVDMTVQLLGRNFSAVDILSVNAYLEASWVKSHPCDGNKFSSSTKPKESPGCSQVAFWGSHTANGQPIAGRNMDGETDPRRVTIANLLVHAMEPEEGRRMISVMWPGYIGTLSGVADNGVYIMENAARISRNYSCIGGGVPAAWIMSEALKKAPLETFASSTLMEKWLLGLYTDDGSGISIGGSIMFIVGPKGAYVYEGDRWGGAMRNPGVADPWDSETVIATNHFLVYGASENLTQNFGQPASFSSLWRYEAGKDYVDGFFARAEDTGAATEADETTVAGFLQTVCGGWTEHSIIWNPSTMTLHIAVAKPGAGKWSAPYLKWRDVPFESVFQ